MTEQTIFLAALDIRDPAERTAYLDRACGADAALRQQVEALLAAHDRSGLFLDEPALEQLAAGPAGERPTVTADPNAPAGPDTPTLTSPDSAASGADDLGFLKPPTRPDSLGRLDRYEVLEVLGRGGFGTVLRAFDERLHRVVAIKVLASQLAASGSARARFNREARAGAAVRDEHVVNIHEVSPADEPVPYLVMEYVSGQTLQQKLDRAGPLSVPEVLRIGAQVARGLAAAHATGHIHRDIKPSNILLENGVERAKLTDFGLARAADDASISHSGVVAGTPMYMAPEQAKGERIDHRADLFSLGSVLYAMCTGRPPFRATTTMAVLKRVCETDPRPIREINPEVPDWLETIIARLHAKKPGDRFQSAREVADLLQQHLAHVLQPGEAPMPARVAVPKPSEPERGRWRSVAIVSAIVLLLYGAFMAGRYMFSDAVKLYMLGMGELQIDGFYSEFDSFIVTSDASPEFVNGFPLPAHVPVFVEPGTYRIRAAGKNHEKAQTWEIKDPREALGVATLQSGEECTLEIERGQRVSVSVSKWAPPTNPPGGEWVQLFNGKDLTGWVPVGVPLGERRAKVVNGVLVCDYESHLRTEQKYHDYELTFEYRHTKPPRKNDDLQLFFHIAGEPNPFTPCMSVRLLNTGALVMQPSWIGSKGTTKLATGELKPRGEWNRLTAVAKGDMLAVSLNGEKLGEITGCDPRAGFISFENGSDELQVRRIEIKELPPSPAEAA
ncbi:MAG: protein kinase, partial [Zavarzinella sp.]|nr:protein kinase [Zavarzinella sp.]